MPLLTATLFPPFFKKNPVYADLMKKQNLPSDSFNKETSLNDVPSCGLEVPEIHYNNQDNNFNILNEINTFKREKEIETLTNEYDLVDYVVRSGWDLSEFNLYPLAFSLSRDISHDIEIFAENSELIESNNLLIGELNANITSLEAALNDDSLSSFSDEYTNLYTECEFLRSKVRDLENNVENVDNDNGVILNNIDFKYDLYDFLIEADDADLDTSFIVIVGLFLIAKKLKSFDVIKSFKEMTN